MTADRCSGADRGCGEAGATYSLSLPCDHGARRLATGRPAPVGATPRLSEGPDAWGVGDLGARVVAAARGWLGTPYRHQASCRGVGCDCLGLVRGVWREVVGPEPERAPAYTPDWAEATGEERLMAAAARRLVRVADEARAGDVLLFRMVERGPAKHAGVLVSERMEGGVLVHAYSGHGVCETRLGEAWLRRLAGVFRFPGG